MYNFEDDGLENDFLSLSLFLFLSHRRACVFHTDIRDQTRPDPTRPDGRKDQDKTTGPATSSRVNLHLTRCRVEVKSGAGNDNEMSRS